LQYQQGFGNKRGFSDIYYVRLNRMRFAVAATLLIFAAPVAAAPDQADTPKPVKEKKICRFEQDTTSRMRRHTCHTASEWKQIDAEGQIGLGELRRIQDH
jgi:hypothetical protein